MTDLPVPPMHAIKMFFCYAHEDDALREQLVKHLSPLQRLRYITGWFYRDIQAGIDWEQEIETRIESANIILLLVSADFIASDYCYSVEMVQALQKHHAGTACVIPIILRPVAWEETPLGELSALPIGKKPVTRWVDQDEAWLNIVQGIRNVVRTLLPKHLLSQQETSILYGVVLRKEHYPAQAEDQSKKTGTPIPFTSDSGKIDSSEGAHRSLHFIPEPSSPRQQFPPSTSPQVIVPPQSLVSFSSITPPQAIVPSQDSTILPHPLTSRQLKYSPSVVAAWILILLTLLLLGGGSIGIYNVATGRWPWNAFIGQSTSSGKSVQANGHTTAIAGANATRTPSPTSSPVPTIVPDAGFTWCGKNCSKYGFVTEFPSDWQGIPAFKNQGIQFTNPTTPTIHASFKTSEARGSAAIDILKKDVQTIFGSQAGYVASTFPSAANVTIGGSPWYAVAISYNDGQHQSMHAEVYATVFQGKAYIIELQAPDINNQFDSTKQQFFVNMLVKFQFL